MIPDTGEKIPEKSGSTGTGKGTQSADRRKIEEISGGTSDHGGDDTYKDERLADSQVEDLKARVELIDKESPALAVCIHQNSYPQESVRGPQIFYFAHSKEAKKAAEVMQTELKNFDQEHAREIKGNTTYYMLKNTKSPIVIVECGFLSSPVEAGMLIDEAYQQKLAQAIGNGILKYVER